MVGYADLRTLQIIIFNSYAKIRKKSTTQSRESHA